MDFIGFSELNPGFFLKDNLIGLGVFIGFKTLDWELQDNVHIR